MVIAYNIIFWQYGGAMVIAYNIFWQYGGAVVIAYNIIFWQYGGAVVIGDEDCQFDILWRTEYACPQETITSDSCSLKKDIHGIDLDLSPLKGNNMNNDIE